MGKINKEWLSDCIIGCLEAEESLTVFISCQRFFVQGLTAGSVKG